MTSAPEFWLRGPIDGFPDLFQPIVHALLQVQDEIHALMKEFPSELLWKRPAGMASPAFHLQHIAGVIDRMGTYSKAEPLSQNQFDYLKKEGIENNKLTSQELLVQLDLQIAKFLKLLSTTDPKSFSEFRPVGRAQLSSTVGGLLFHAAEHTQRHFGQLLVTVKVILAE